MSTDTIITPDTTDAAGQVTDVEAPKMTPEVEYLTAEAAFINAEIVVAARNVSDTTTRLWWLLQESKAKQSWKFALDDAGKPFKSWRLFIAAKVGSELQNWSKSVRDSFIHTLGDDRFTSVAIAEMTGVSASTVSRVLSGQDQGSDTPASGNAEKTSSAADRFSKTVDGLVGKLADQDRYSAPDLRNKLLVDSTRAAMAVLAEITRRGGRVPAKYVPLATALAGMFPAEGDGSHLESGTEGQVGGAAHPTPAAAQVKVPGPGDAASKAAAIAEASRKTRAA